MFERTPIPGSSLEDIDQTALATYLETRAPALVARQSREAAAVATGMLARSGNALLPTPTCLMVFGYQPQLLFPNWGVAAARIRGCVLTDPIGVREDLEGPLPRLLEAATAFAFDHSQSMERRGDLPESSEYAVVAVREALINALVHRDLRAPGRVCVRVFDDRLEIWSPGAAAAPMIDFTELMQDGGVSVPRNMLLAASARSLGLGEQLGRGLPTMRRLVEARAHTPMTITAGKAGVLVVFPSAFHGGHGSAALLS